MVMLNPVKLTILTITIKSHSVVTTLNSYKNYAFPLSAQVFSLLGQWLSDNHLALMSH